MNDWKRHAANALREKYRQHRKTVNENLGLIIALAASCAALWTGYEARHARLEARDAAENSLKVQLGSVNAQSKAVDAQIAAMRYDERPYVGIKEDGISKSGTDPHSSGEYQAKFSLVARGRTPGTVFKWHIRCGLSRSNQITAFDSADFPKDVADVTSERAVINSSDSVRAICPFSKADYLNSTDEEQVDDTEDRSLRITFLVDVQYSDVFSDKHRTTQCFYIRKYGPSPLGTTLLSCRKFTPAVE